MLKLTLAFLLLAVLSVLVQADIETTTEKNSRSLYNPPVVTLNQTTFESFAYCWHYGNREECTTTVIQFCRSTMELCQQYVPEYWSAASSALPLKQRKILRMGFIDCVDNQEICDKYGYGRVPLLLQFELDGNAGHPGRKLRSLAKAEHILGEVVGALNIEYRKRSGYSAYADWPKFPLLENVTKASDVWAFFDKCDTQAIIVPVENANEPMGFIDFVAAYNKAQVQGKFPVARVSQDHMLVKMQSLGMPNTFMITRNITDAVDCPNPPADISKLPTYKKFLGSDGEKGKEVVDEAFPEEKMIIYKEKK